jgi:hypothetical protein
VRRIVDSEKESRVLIRIVYSEKEQREEKEER